MRHIWRWSGVDDPVPVDDLVRAGMRGVASALDCPPGAVWPPSGIERRKAGIEVMADGTASGLAWEVVETLPVSEAIKTGTGDWRQHVENYRLSLWHLAEAGIRTVCYDFMPLLGRTRTDPAWRRPDGVCVTRFDIADFAAFDIHILGRDGAAGDFSDEVRQEAVRRFAAMDDGHKIRLADALLGGVAGGAGRLGLDDLHELLQEYAALDDTRLRRHCHDFLEQVVPVAQDLGIRLCCHPDDPPFPLLGLARILSTEADLAEHVAAVDLPANGITLCAASLGARPDNDLPGMMRRLGDRVHLLHLGNVGREGEAIAGSFFDEDLLAGDVDMAALVGAARAEEARRRAAGREDAEIPMLPVHGQAALSLGDHRMAAWLAKLRGIRAAPPDGA